jgi:hypothetical protein
MTAPDPPGPCPVQPQGEYDPPIFGQRERPIGNEAEVHECFNDEMRTACPLEGPDILIILFDWADSYRSKRELEKWRLKSPNVKRPSGWSWSDECGGTAGFESVPPRMREAIRGPDCSRGHLEVKEQALIIEFLSSTENRRKQLLIRPLEEQNSRHKHTTLPKDQDLASIVSIINEFTLNGRRAHHNEWLHEPTIRCDINGHRGRF